eukprot:COSAG05_NODE_832_length_7073_cov_4.937482_2_plen_91_part_00
MQTAQFTEEIDLKGRWEQEMLLPMQWNGIEEVQRGQRAPAEPLCVGSAVGPLWVNAGPINAGAQVLATWQVLAFDRGYSCSCQGNQAEHR